MTPEDMVAALTALAAILGALLEFIHRRHEAEIVALRERLRAVEVRCERLEARP